MNFLKIFIFKEVHLSGLVKISINYVRELRRTSHSSNNSTKSASINNSKNEHHTTVTLKKSVTANPVSFNLPKPQSISSLEIDEQQITPTLLETNPNVNEIKTTPKPAVRPKQLLQDSKKKESTERRNNAWFSSISLIRTFSSTTSVLVNEKNQEKVKLEQVDINKQDNTKLENFECLPELNELDINNNRNLTPIGQKRNPSKPLVSSMGKSLSKRFFKL